MLIKLGRYSNTPKINHDAMTCNMRHEECPKSSMMNYLNVEYLVNMLV